MISAYEARVRAGSAQIVLVTEVLKNIDEGIKHMSALGYTKAPVSTTKQLGKEQRKFVYKMLCKEGYKVSTNHGGYRFPWLIQW